MTKSTMLKKNEINVNKSVPTCPKCKSESISRFCCKRDKKRYLYKNCGKTFVDSTNAVIYHSHYGEAVWKRVKDDTISGTPLCNTTASLEMSESTAFRIRYKVLMALEANENSNPTVLNGVCELDETYVLESYKGIKASGGLLVQTTHTLGKNIKKRLV